MSKIALSGNASGTGTLTIAAPNTNTDRTLTLPDNSGTLLSNASTAGFPAGSVLQVVYAAYDPGSQSTTSTSFITTGLTATITPSSTSSRILAFVCMYQNYVPNASSAVGFELRRNGTAVSDTGNGTLGYSSAINNYFNTNMHIVDSPASTSALTYTLFFKSFYGNSVSINGDNTSSYLTLMEIAG